MADIWRSARAYFWPLIVANVLAAAYGAGAQLAPMVPVGLSLAALASFGFLANDLFDRRIDLANEAGHFERSEPSTVRVSRWCAAGLCLAGLAMAAVAGTMAFTIAVAIASALAVYSPVLRRWRLLPNVVTALVATSPLWVPMIMAPTRGHTWQWLLVVGFGLMLTGREIFMDVRDRHGDAAGGRATLATDLGASQAIAVGATFSIVGALVLLAAPALDDGTRARWASLSAAVLTAGMLGLSLIPAARIRTANTQQLGNAIQHYVRRSRLVMALAPALTLLLAWRS